MGVRDENKREFLMLAGSYDESKKTCIDPTGWYMSEKLDGMRCFWDGGISKGKVVTDVPYANWNEKDKHLTATGLWSRGGKVIHAPEWFTQNLPRLHMLDGEMWNPGMKLQDIVSITRAHGKEKEWEKLKYWVFDSPMCQQFLKTGRVHIRDWEEQLPDMMSFNSGVVEYSDDQTFQDFVDDWVGTHHVWAEETWEVLPQFMCKSREHMHAFLESTVKGGGEGVMLRRPESVWHPRRARKDLLKVKKFYDAEAEVIGYTFGKLTKKDSRLRGMIGALIVREVDTGHVFELAGLNDSEREVQNISKPYQTKRATDWAFDNPGEEAPTWIGSVKFPRGSQVTFKYWDRTKDGLPKFAQYFRARMEE